LSYERSRSPLTGGDACHRLAKDET